jgi:hypothetical protein
MVSCPKCGSSKTVKDGVQKYLHSISQRFLCKDCNYYFSVNEENKIPKKRLSRIDLAYIAGIIDGEGSLMLYRHGRSKCNPGTMVYNAQLAVTNTNKDLMNWLSDKLSKYSYPFKTKVYLRKTPSNQKQIYQLAVRGFKLLYLLQDLLPFLIVKKKQAEKLIEWIIHRKAVLHLTNNAKRTYTEYDEGIKNCISILNRRGI